MALEENKVIVRKMLEAINKQDLALLDDLVVPEYVNLTMQLRSREEFKQFLSLQFRGFPDLHRNIEDIAAEGDKVWIRATITGTHTGEYRGLAPTGKKIIITAVPIYRIVEGKIIEGWSVADFLDLYKQLGVIEYKGFPAETMS